MLSSAYVTPEVSHETLAIYINSGHKSWVTDSDRFDDLMGSYNHAGDFAKIEETVELILGDVNIQRESSSIDPITLEAILNTGAPVIAGVGNGSHYVLIYNCVRFGDANQDLTLYVYDPDSDADENPHIMSYECFCGAYGFPWVESIWIGDN